MKQYQENWLESINEDEGNNNLLRVCCDIKDDDTGCTDALTMRLAEILKQRLVVEEFNSYNDKDGHA